MQNQVESRLFLDVVVRQGTAVFQLLSGKDQTLLIGWNALLVLDLGLDILDGVTWLNLKGDGLTGQSLDKDLHTTTQTQNQVESGLFLDVVVRQGAAVFKLLSGKDQTLLVWWNALFVLDLGLDILNGITWLNLKGDG